MKILIRSTLALVLISILIGFNQELLIKLVIILVLLSTLMKYADVIISTPDPYHSTQPNSAKAIPLATNPTLSESNYPPLEISREQLGQFG